MKKYTGVLSSAALLLCLASCLSEDGEHGEDGDDGDIEQTTDEITATDAMARAHQWVNLAVPYCGGPRNGEDELCGGICRRPAAPWDNFRSDCSGYVSWAWQIPDQPDTHVYVHDRGGSNGWTTIPIDSMRPGDAFVTNGHMMLFSHFVDRDTVDVLEEFKCREVAREHLKNFSRSGNTVRFVGDGRVYHAIRRNGLTPPPSVPPPPVPPAPTACGVVQPGHGLGPGRSISSCDNRFFLAMQTDGNLVLYQRPSTPLWATHTTTGYIAQMQPDGNFVVYDRQRHPIFNTVSAGNSGARFAVQNDGNAVVYSTSNRPLWSSRTCCR